MQKKQIDFLDTLRYLNSTNINNSKELKDMFFNSLIKNEELLPIYIKELAESWGKAMESDCAEGMKNIITNSKYSFEIARQLQDIMIEDGINSLYLEPRDAHYILTYLAAIKGEKELVEVYPEGFDFFKQYFLLGLITRYSKYIGRSNESKDRLDKLVSIYIEQQIQIKFKIKPREELDSYIDEEFINDIKEAQNSFINIDTMSSILNKLFDRKTKKYKIKTLHEVIKEYRKKLLECKTEEERRKIYMILDNLYEEKDSSYYGYEEQLQFKINK